MTADLPTVSAADVIARRPCGDWSARIPPLCARYRRDRWSALEILSVDDVSAEDRLWVCLHPSLVPAPVLARFVCEVAAEALRVAGVTDARSWAALDVRLRHARGEATDAELAAARDAARDAARAAARDAQVITLRTLLLLHADGYDVTRGAGEVDYGEEGGLTRPTLRELARKRGYSGVDVGRSIAAGGGHLAMAFRRDALNDDGVECYAPTRRAAEAGLRAALLAMPVKKTKEKKR